MISTQPITSNVHFDYLMKVVSVRLLNSTVQLLFSPFVVNAYLEWGVGGRLKLGQYPILHQSYKLFIYLLISL